MNSQVEPILHGTERAAFYQTLLNLYPDFFSDYT